MDLNLGTKRRKWDTLSGAEVMLNGGMEPALEPLVGTSIIFLLTSKE